MQKLVSGYKRVGWKDFFTTAALAAYFCRATVKFKLIVLARTLGAITFYFILLVKLAKHKRNYLERFGVKGGVIVFVQSIKGVNSALLKKV